MTQKPADFRPGAQGRARNYVYGSAKAGFTAFPLSGLRNRLSGTGVRVITVLPGYVATRMTEGMPMPGLLTVPNPTTWRRPFSLPNAGTVM